MKQFVHEPFSDFSLQGSRTKYEEALKYVESQLGQTYPLIIDGQKITTTEEIISTNPAKHEEVVGRVAKASQQHAQAAIEAALQAFDVWRFYSAEARADILLKAAFHMRQRKFEFSAWLTKEAGKTWIEADVETAEAIDFLTYYAEQMLILKDGAPVASRQFEVNRYRYIPLGVGIVISPWNFPLAIMAGTTVAMLVTGNTAILKPASTTPVIAYKFMELMEQCGLPKGVLNFLPGSGAEIGDYLIQHDKTRLISFTGSRDVGINIYKEAAIVRPNQIWLKRMIAEMGGKDTIVVDAECDTTLAAQSIVKSAFGFSGQKCSACSRAVIVDTVYDEVVEKIHVLTKSLRVGMPHLCETEVGSVIDEAAFSKITSYIDIGKNEGRLLVGGEGDSSTGYFIQPTVFVDVEPNARIMQEEIFGPVLAVARAQTMEQAIEIANNTQYGLTGAFISTNRAHIDYAKQHFYVGNLYINRGCTGAIVGYQPFGGFNLSGTDSKAGGPDYLLLHLQGQSITEQF